MFHRLASGKASAGVNERNTMTTLTSLPLPAVPYAARPRTATLGLHGFVPALRWIAPIGGAWLGWTRGDDLLRGTRVGGTLAGWVARSPLGGMFADPYKPVGGALGALAGYALGNWF